MVPNSNKSYTGRIVTIISIIVGLLGATVPVVADMDLTSTAGVIAGLAALSAVVVKFLDGWQQYEARLDGLGTGVGPVDEPATETGAGPEPGIDPDEPAAPLPGEPFEPFAMSQGEELPDIPSPPADDEIHAVAEEPAAGDPGDNARKPVHA
jgi:hypothetical protein